MRLPVAESATRLLKLEMFGSWEDQGFGPVYVVSAQCSTGCHEATLMITPEELDYVGAADIIWWDTERHIRDEFAKVHG